MQRTAIWAQAVAIILVFAMRDEHVAAQQIPDPAPIGDEEELESDLPLPQQLPDGRQDLRDYSRAFLGVTFDPKVRDAAVARSVSAGSPADQSGVRAGDTIVSLNGQKVGTYDDVLATIAKLRPGDVLDVEISRRVSVKARAVLEGQPVGGEHTTGYHVEAERLPAPASSQTPPRTIRTPANANTQRPRPNESAPQNRSSNVNRSDDSNERDRDDRGRGRFLRRRG